MPRRVDSEQTLINFPRRRTRSTATGKEDAKPLLSPPSSPRKRPSSRISGENVPVQVDDKPVASPRDSPKKRKNNKCLAVATDTENISPRKVAQLSLGRPEGQCYSTAKQVLHSSLPDRLLCREKEVSKIQDFLNNHFAKKQPGSLYISGPPGTGKTACLMQIVNSMSSGKPKHTIVFVNCMSIKHSQGIFTEVALRMSGKRMNFKESQKYLTQELVKPGPMILLVLDEMDQLESKSQEVLYTMFEWSTLKNSRLVLIGIANALDLTDRILPRLQAKPNCRPKLLHFSPYSKDQIVTILQDRLSEMKDTSVLDEKALQFCARKVSADAGDMRKALDICRRAVEVVEGQVRKQQVLKMVGGSCSPKKPSSSGTPVKVSLPHIAKVVSEVYGSRIAATSRTGETPTIPLQQKVLICSLLLMLKEGKSKEIPVGKLHETYCKVCKSRKVTEVNQEDFHSLCTLLESRGILGLKSGKDRRMDKVSLKIDENEVDHALQDKILLSGILSAGIPV